MKFAMSAKSVSKRSLSSVFTAHCHMSSEKYESRGCLSVSQCFLFFHFADPHVLSIRYVLALVSGSTKLKYDWPWSEQCWYSQVHLFDNLSSNRIVWLNLIQCALIIIILESNIAANKIFAFLLGTCIKNPTFFPCTSYRKPIVEAEPAQHYFSFLQIDFLKFLLLFCKA